MGKSTPQAPQAPDPQVTAAAQTQSNIQTANANATLNHSNQTTPWGTQTWTAGTPDANGVSQWTSNVTLSPSQQALLDSSDRISQSLSNLGEKQLGTVGNTLGQPFNYNNAPSQVTGVPTRDVKNSANYGTIQNDVDLGGANLQKTFEDSQKAAYNQQTQYLDPKYKQDQQDLENKLIQQGVLQGTEAWDKATQNLGQQRTFDYNNAFNNSYSTGLAAQNQLYGQALSNAQFHNGAQAQGFGQSATNTQLYNAAQQQQFGNDLTNANLQNQGRTQAINEANYLRQQPLNELNALRTGSQVTAPQFGGTPQGSVAPTDIASLYNSQYQGQLAQYNAGVSTGNSNTQGIVGLAAAAAAAY